MNLSNFHLKIAAVAVVIFFDFLPAASAQTAAPLIICNKTNEQAHAAVGYFSPGINDSRDRNVLTGPFVSQGWWDIETGACQTFENPFDARYMFWYAFTQSHPRMPEDPQKTHFCISFSGSGTGGFTFEEENASSQACSAARNSRWFTATRSDTWINATVDFTGQ